MAKGSFDTALDAFYEVAAAACDHIADKSPDLVIALMQAGRFPLLATQVLWGQTQQRPFPPVLLTNIGTEKMRRYEEQCFDIMFNGYLFHNVEMWGKGHTFDFQHRETGHLLAWALRQQHWLDELGKQIEQLLGSACVPRRILVLEDFIQDGRSCLLSHGLLQGLYPGCEVAMLSTTVSDWRDRAADAWLDYHGSPDLKSALIDLTYITAYGRRNRTGLYCLNRVVTGTEDMEREALSWKPLTPENGPVQGLSPYLSFDECIAVSAWVEQTIVAHVQEAAAGWLPGADHQVRRAALLPQQLLSAYLWLHGCSAPATAAAWAGISQEAATRIFSSFIREGWAVWRDGETGRCCDLIRHGILLYGAAAWTPDPYLLEITERITETRTPFPVEFAWTNGEMGPYLIPVPEGNGAVVPARLLHLIPDIGEEDAYDRLMHPESQLLSQPRVQYDEKKENEAKDPIVIQRIDGIDGVDYVYFVHTHPNIPGILATDRTLEEKAEILARIALTSERVAGDKEVDGVAYLKQALAQGIATPLTTLYHRKVVATPMPASTTQNSVQPLSD